MFDKSAFVEFACISWRRTMVRWFISWSELTSCPSDWAADAEADESRRCLSVPMLLLLLAAAQKKIHFQLQSPKRIVPNVQRSQIWSVGLAAARWTHGDALLLAERLDDGGSGRLENLPGEPHSAVRRVSAKVFHLFKDVTRRCKRAEIHLGGGQSSLLDSQYLYLLSHLQT